MTSFKEFFEGLLALIMLCLAWWCFAVLLYAVEQDIRCNNGALEYCVKEE